MAIAVELEGYVATIVIDNPPVNALHPAVAEELQQAFDRLAVERPDLRAVVITGAGKHFVAGGDIKFFQTLDPVSSGHYARRIQIIQESISNYHCPVIAAVNGTCLGGGCELSMACDIRVASDRAIFGLPEVRLGIISAAGGTQNLPRLVPVGTAKRLLFTGDRVGAEEALSIGLIDIMVPHDRVGAEAKALAERIAQSAPLAVSAAKQAVNIGLDLGVHAGLRYEAELFAGLFRGKDVSEGVSAFLEKRDAEFKGH